MSITDPNKILGKEIELPEKEVKQAISQDLATNPKLIEELDRMMSANIEIAHNTLADLTQTDNSKMQRAMRLERNLNNDMQALNAGAFTALTAVIKGWLEANYPPNLHATMGSRFFNACRTMIFDGVKEKLKLKKAEFDTAKQDAMQMAEANSLVSKRTHLDDPRLVYNLLTDDEKGKLSDFKDDLKPVQHQSGTSNARSGVNVSGSVDDLVDSFVAHPLTIVFESSDSQKIDCTVISLDQYILLKAKDKFADLKSDIAKLTTDEITKNGKATPLINAAVAGLEGAAIDKIHADENSRLNDILKSIDLDSDKITIPNGLTGLPDGLNAGMEIKLDSAENFNLASIYLNSLYYNNPPLEDVILLAQEQLLLKEIESDQTEKFEDFALATNEEMFVLSEDQLKALYVDTSGDICLGGVTLDPLSSSTGPALSPGQALLLYDAALFEDLSNVNPRVATRLAAAAKQTVDTVSPSAGIISRVSFHGTTALNSIEELKNKLLHEPDLDTKVDGYSELELRQFALYYNIKVPVTQRDAFSEVLKEKLADDIIRLYAPSELKDAKYYESTRRADFIETGSADDLTGFMNNTRRVVCQKTIAESKKGIETDKDKAQLKKRIMTNIIDKRVQALQERQERVRANMTSDFLEALKDMPILTTALQGLGSAAIFTAITTVSTSGYASLFTGLGSGLLTAGGVMLSPGVLMTALGGYGGYLGGKALLNLFRGGGKIANIVKRDTLEQNLIELQDLGSKITINKSNYDLQLSSGPLNKSRNAKRQWNQYKIGLYEKTDNLVEESFPIAEGSNTSKSAAICDIINHIYTETDVSDFFKKIQGETAMTNKLQQYSSLLPMLGSVLGAGYGAHKAPVGAFNFSK